MSHCLCLYPINIVEFVNIAATLCNRNAGRGVGLQAPNGLINVNLPDNNELKCGYIHRLRFTLRTKWCASLFWILDSLPLWPYTPVCWWDCKKTWTKTSKAIWWVCHILRTTRNCSMQTKCNSVYTMFFFSVLHAITSQDTCTHWSKPYSSKHLKMLRWQIGSDWVLTNSQLKQQFLLWLQ